MTQINESALARRILKREQVASQLAAKNARDKQRLRVKQQHDRKKRFSQILRQIEQMGLLMLTDAEFSGVLVEAQARVSDAGQRERWRRLAQEAGLASPGSDAEQAVGPFLRETGDVTPTHPTPLPSARGWSG